MWINKNKWLLLVLVAGSVVRGGLVFFLFGDFDKDPDAYKQIAQNVVNKHQYGQAFGNSSESQSTAFRPPLYPLTLSLFVTEIDETAARGDDYKKVDTASVALLHIWLSVFTIFFAYLFARQFGLCDFRSALVALTVALDPIGVRQSSLVMTETMAVFFATFGLYLFGRIFSQKSNRLPFFFYGVLCGVFSMCRPTFLIWGGLIFLAMAFQRAITRDVNWQKKWTTLVVFFFGVILAIAPWTVRNYLQFGKPVFATTHGGYTIYLGNNDSFYDYLGSGKSHVWDGEKELRDVVLEIREASKISESKGSFKIDEVKKDKMYYDKAMEVIRRRPTDFAYACWIRVIRFWSIIPNSKEDSKLQSLIGTASAFWYGLIFSAALVGLFRLGRVCLVHVESRWTIFYRFLPGILLVIAFQGLHLVYWSNMRMRAPLVALIALLAVLSLVKSDVLKKIGEETKEKSKSVGE